jgi:hypothetical protein
MSADHNLHLYCALSSRNMWLDLYYIILYLSCVRRTCSWLTVLINKSSSFILNVWYQCTRKAADNCGKRRTVTLWFIYQTNGESTSRQTRIRYSIAYRYEHICTPVEILTSFQTRAVFWTRRKTMWRADKFLYLANKPGTNETSFTNNIIMVLVITVLIYRLYAGYLQLYTWHNPYF